MTQRTSKPQDATSEGGVTVALPECPPMLSPRAARALLQLLTSVHNTQPATRQDEVRWDKTG